MNSNVVFTIVVAGAVGIAIALFCSHHFAYRQGTREGARIERESWWTRLTTAWNAGLSPLFYRRYAYEAHKQVAETGVTTGPDVSNWLNALETLRLLGFFQHPSGMRLIANVHNKGNLRDRFPFVDFFWSNPSDGLPTLEPKPWRVSFLNQWGEEIDHQLLTCRRTALTEWDVNKLERAATVVVLNPDGKPVAKQERNADGTWERPEL